MEILPVRTDGPFNPDCAARKCDLPKNRTWHHSQGAAYADQRLRSFLRYCNRPCLRPSGSIGFCAPLFPWPPPPPPLTAWLSFVCDLFFGVPLRFAL